MSSDEVGMWRRTRLTCPALGERVIGFLSKDGEVAWWTRTHDGWYVSASRHFIGHRDAPTKASSSGPDFWAHAPLITDMSKPDNE